MSTDIIIYRLIELGYKVTIYHARYTEHITVTAEIDSQLSYTYRANNLSVALEGLLKKIKTQNNHENYERD